MREEPRAQQPTGGGGLEMGLSAIAIRRPVFVVMVTLGFLVLGLVGFSRLGTDLFPDVSFPVVVVNVAYPGASPSEVESQVTRPLEDAIVGVNGLDRIRSFSRDSLSTVVVFFTMSTEIQDAATQVRERVAQVRMLLPKQTLEPSIGRLDIAASPILTYTVSGDRSLSEIRKFAEDVIKPGLEQVPGVALVEVEGGAEREISVLLDRARIDALRLDPQSVLARLSAANLTVPAGRFDEGPKEIAVRTVAEFRGVEDVRNTVVASAPDGSVVRLRDVAEVVDGFKEMRTRVRVNGEEAVSFAIKKNGGENTVAVSDRATVELERMAKTFPSDIQLARIVDQSRFVKDNAQQVQGHIVFGGIMAILVILLFMMDLRSTLISSVALPTSVIATFFAMYLLDFTLNMMTLLALSLAIGLLIDDAVVVRENIFKHMERGKDPFTAALDGTKEVALSVLACTLTVIAVFLPVAFVEGLVGQFFRQFGITISCAVALSLLVAFTLDPMLSARFSKPVHERSHTWDWLKRPIAAMFDAIDALYTDTLRWALNHKLWIGALSIGSLVFMGFIAGLMGSEFVNAEDRGQFMVEIELPAGTSLEETSRLSGMAEDVLLKHPEIVTVYATIGPAGQANAARWRVVTTHKKDRTISLPELREIARHAALTAGPETKVNVTEPPFVEGAQAEAPIMVQVRGNDFSEIQRVAGEVGEILRGTPGVEEVQIKFSPGRPELQVRLDDVRVADQRMVTAQIAMALRASMEGEEAGKVREGKDEIPIRVRLAEGDRDSAIDVGELTLWTPKGLVKLSDVAELVRDEGPQVIEREGRMRQIQIWATPQGRPLGDLLAEFDPKIQAIRLAPGMSVAYDGQIRLMNETNSNMGIALLLGVVFIYIVLASQFESFIHPVTIMLTLPLAFVGAFVGLFLAGQTMAMGAMIGIILLMGLVTKNAILLVDRAIVRVREHGETPYDAILAAGPERLRPILMTSAAMVLGMLPTAISQGEGSEFRSPMAIAIIGGMISSTLLSLVVVPAFYLAIENVKAKIMPKRARSAVAVTDAG